MNVNLKVFAFCLIRYSPARIAEIPMFLLYANLHVPGSHGENVSIVAIHDTITHNASSRPNATSSETCCLCQLRSLRRRGEALHESCIGPIIVKSHITFPSSSQYNHKQHIPTRSCDTSWQTFPLRFIKLLLMSHMHGNEHSNIA